MIYDARKTGVFKEKLITIAGQALNAAGYTLEENPVQHQRGLIRFSKALGENVYGFIEWQLLAFAHSPVDRFQIILLRNEGRDPRAISDYPHRAERYLSWVIWHVFEARILPSDDAWWDFRDEVELGHALANAGRALFGYGVPWLEMRGNLT